MTKLADFNINELMLFIVGVLGAVGAFMLILQKSKCEEVNCCCFKCKRDVKAIIEEEKLALGRMPTPRKPSLAEMNKEVKMELKRESEETEEEPEVEKVS